MVHNPKNMKVHEYPQMKIRLSPELKAMIDESAKANKRTLNAEISARLEQSYKNQSSNFSLEEIRSVIREELEKQKK